MDPIAFRKIIVTGMRFDEPDGAPLLDADGLPVDPRLHPVVMQVTFWVPMPIPFGRGAGGSIVQDAKLFELQGLADGVIGEQVFEFNFPKQPSLESLRDQMGKFWDRLCAESLALASPLINVPRDNNPKPSIVFGAVQQAIKSEP